VSADPKATYKRRFERQCRVLRALIVQVRALGGDPREAFPAGPIMLFDIDDAASDKLGFPAYRRTDVYRKICSTLRRRIGDLRQQ